MKYTNVTLTCMNCEFDYEASVPLPLKFFYEINRNVMHCGEHDLEKIPDNLIRILSDKHYWEDVSHVIRDEFFEILEDITGGEQIENYFLVRENYICTVQVIMYIKEIIDEVEKLKEKQKRIIKQILGL